MKRTAKQYARDIRNALDDLVAIVNAARNDEDLALTVHIRLYNGEDSDSDLMAGDTITQEL